MTTDKKMVPVEPTEEMIRAAQMHMRGAWSVYGIWQVMFAAAPAEPKAAALSDEVLGLYRKYEVHRRNDPTGKHLNCAYYVLDLMHDKFAADALDAYATACKAEFPKLSFDLRLRAGSIRMSLPPYKRSKPGAPAEQKAAATYWLIERNQLHGESSARWFSERRCFTQGDQDLWVQDVTRAEHFPTKKLADKSITDRFTCDGVFTPDQTYPVLPIATEHMDMSGPEQKPASPSVATSDSPQGADVSAVALALPLTREQIAKFSEGLSGSSEPKTAAAPTPRTDALKIPSEALLLLGQKGVPEQITKAILTLGDHSRQLERELSAMRAENERIISTHKGLMQFQEQRTEVTDRELAAADDTITILREAKEATIKDAVKLRQQRDGLLAKLEELLGQVDSLNGYELTRDIDRYKAESNWDHAKRAARGAIERCKP
jgi:hypothetical protein